MREVKDMENFLIQAAYDEKAVETASVREITASGVSLVIPAEYLGMERMEGDPEDAEIYGFNSEESDGVAFFSLIPREDALTFGDVDSVIENVHEILEESQGLIRVGSGSTASGRPFIYTIIKNVTEEGVLQYTLTLQIALEDRALNVQGFFNETGDAKKRERAVYSLRRILSEPWAADPYDPTFTRGRLMTQAERAAWDRDYPTHALSEARKLVKCLVEKN